MKPGKWVYSRSTGWNVKIENVYTNGDILIKADKDYFMRVTESDLAPEHENKPRNPNCK
jgi:hypothetical protein